MVDPPSSFFFFNIPAFKIPPEQGQLEHVDDDCPEDEEEVDEDPEGKGRYTLSNLRRPSLYVLLTKDAKQLYFHLRGRGYCGNQKGSEGKKQSHEKSHSSRDNLKTSQLEFSFSLPEEISRMIPTRKQHRKG